jgi:hypothetical protein
LKGLDVVGNIILKWIIKKYFGSLWGEFVGLKMA